MTTGGGLCFGAGGASGQTSANSCGACASTNAILNFNDTSWKHIVLRAHLTLAFWKPEGLREANF
jgi:hypothetical protein